MLIESNLHNSVQPAASIAETCWYAVRVRARAEKLVAAALHGKGYDPFLPLYRKRTQWSDRTKDVDLPVFPGYVLCRADLSGRPPVITTPNVIGLVSFGGTLGTISEEEIDGIKTIVRSGAAVEPWPYLREGERVRVHSGLLAGTEGILLRVKNDWRIVLSIELLGRSVAVEVDRALTVPLSSPLAPAYV